MVRGLSPGVLLVPGVGASFLGVGVLDFRLGVEDLSFCNRDAFKYVHLCVCVCGCASDHHTESPDLFLYF